MVRGFYWLIEGALAGCGRPGGPDGRLSASDARLDADLDSLRGQGIGAILSLTEDPIPEEALERHELHSLHLPVTDMTAPPPDVIMRALSFIDGERAAGRAVAVHCRMGQGRTGTILAAYLVRGGKTPDEAIGEVRTVCSGAVEVEGQVQALHAFADRRDWIL